MKFDIEPRWFRIVVLMLIGIGLGTIVLWIALILTKLFW